MKKYIRLIQRYNKSRKGEYVQIREKGKTSLYRYHEGTPLDAYQQYYYDTHNKRRKKKGTIKQYEEIFRGTETKRAKVSLPLKRFASKYKKSIERRPTIDRNIRKGITSVGIRDIHSITDFTKSRRDKKLGKEDKK